MRKVLKRWFFIFCMVLCVIAGSMLPGGASIEGEMMGVEAMASSFTQAIEDAADLEKAQNYIQNHLPQIRETVDYWMQTSGSESWLEGFGDCIRRKSQEVWEKLMFFQVNADGEEDRSFKVKFYLVDLLGEIEKFFSSE